MVTLDDKFAHFSKSVIGKAEQDFQAQLAAIDQKHQQLLDRFKTEIEEKAAELKAKTLHQALYEKKMKLSRAQLTRKRRIITAKEEMMERLMHRVRQELEAFVASEAYLPFLEGMVRRAAPVLQQMEGLVLRLRPQDQERCGAALISTVNAVAPGLWQGVRFEDLPEASIGGMMLLNDQRTVRFDLTLQTLLEDQRGMVGELLHDTFDKAGMNDE